MFKAKQKIGLIGMTVAVFVVARACDNQFLALAASSENYQIQKDTLNFGGGNTASTNYTAEGTMGEAATGEGLSSENYGVCSGFQCMGEGFYLSFSVKEGTARPGTGGAGVNLGLLDTGSIATSDGASINSIFLTAESSADDGLVVTVHSEYGGLARQSAPSEKIDSATTTLTVGTEGYGLCVFSIAEGASSPTTLESASPYSSSCDKDSAHQIGLVDSTSRTIVESSGKLLEGDAEILVKAAAGAISAAGDDYTDTLTFIATATY